MKSFLQIGSVAAVTLALVASQAQAAKLCNLTGSYSDNYGSTTSIKGKKGSILNTAICPTAYTFKITNETATGFTVTGTNKTTSCGTFTAMPMFMGSCEVFGGSVTINGQTISDTFTEIGAARRQPPASSDLTRGMR